MRMTFYRHGVFLTVLAVCLVASANLSGAVDMFLKIEGIPGESQDKDHSGEIDLLSFSWGAVLPVSDSIGGGAGRPQVSDLTVTKHVDKASPRLFEALATGKHQVMAELTVRRAGEGQRTPYLTFTLENVIVTSYSVSGSAAGDSVPTEEISFNFTEIEYAYTETNPDGSAGDTISIKYNVAENTVE